MSETQILVIVAVGTTIQYLIYCLYLRNLNRLLKAIQPANRHMPPGQVWVLALWFINLACGYLDMPELEYLRFDIVRNICRGIDIVMYLFLLFWQFRTVSGIAVSIEHEYRSRSLQISSRPSYAVGVTMLVFGVIYMAEFLPDSQITDIIAQISSWGYMIFWIIYWVQTHRYKKRIRAMQRYFGQPDSPIFSNLY